MKILKEFSKCVNPYQINIVEKCLKTFKNGWWYVSLSFLKSDLSNQMKMV